jgi:hypothetical protein
MLFKVMKQHHNSHDSRISACVCTVVLLQITFCVCVCLSQAETTHLES